MNIWLGKKGFELVNILMIFWLGMGLVNGFKNKLGIFFFFWIIYWMFWGVWGSSNGGIYFGR